MVRVRFLQKLEALHEKYVGCQRYRGVRKRAELLWDKARQRWYLKYALEVADKVIHGSNRGAAIDLGVRVAASLSIEGVGPCRRQCVGTVYIGWPKGIRENRVYSKKWAARIHNFWGFDASGKILQAALERQGIMVRRVGERGSSSTCPVTSCGSKKVARKPRHILSCRVCDTTLHSDQAGSRNMLSFNHPGTGWDAVKTTVRPDTLCWNKQRWVDAGNRNDKTLLRAA
jgi:transposase